MLRSFGQPVFCLGKAKQRSNTRVLQGVLTRHKWKTGDLNLLRLGSFYPCFVCLSSSQKVCYKGLSIQGLLSLTYSFWLIPLLFLCLASAKRHQNQSNYLKNYYARDACSFHLPIFRKGKTKSWRNASCIAKVFNTAFAKKRRCKTNKTWGLKPKLFGSPICRSLYLMDFVLTYKWNSL